MRLTDLFWLFLIFSALQPFIRQKWLEASRLRLLKRSEQKRGSIAIALVHRQETISLLGIPLMRYIDVHDKEPKDIDDQTLILADVARKAPGQYGDAPGDLPDHAPFPPADPRAPHGRIYTTAAPSGAGSAWRLRPTNTHHLHLPESYQGGYNVGKRSVRLECSCVQPSARSLCH